MTSRTYRILGEVVDADKDPAEVCFPGYDANHVFLVPRGALESAGVSLEQGGLFGAMANLGAESASELNPSEFSPVEVTEDEARAVWES